MPTWPGLFLSVSTCLLGLASGPGRDSPVSNAISNYLSSTPSGQAEEALGV